MIFCPELQILARSPRYVPLIFCSALSKKLSVARRINTIIIYASRSLRGAKPPLTADGFDTHVCNTLLA